jgi:hypothetical protein
VRRIDPDREDYPVSVSERLDELRRRITERLEGSG